MTAQDQGLVSLHFSINGHPATEAVDEFRETFAKTILRIGLEPLKGHNVSLDMQLYGLPDFGMAAGSFGPGSYPHKGSLIDSDDIVLVAVHEGFCTFENNRLRMDAPKNSVTMTSVGEPATYSSGGNVRTTNLSFNRKRLAPYLAGLDDALSSPQLRPGPALDLLFDYARIIEGGERFFSPELRHSVVTHMHDLAALAIGANRDGREIAKQRGVRAARLREVKRYILENLARPDLGLSYIALRTGLSPRYVSLLFETTGETLSEFVLHQRLERARRMLSDFTRRRTISSIAFECGFSDLSYFNRTFRRRFGMTPSDLRAGKD